MRRVRKTIQSLSDYLKNLSPGGTYELLLGVYRVAKQNIYLVDARSLPKRSNHDQYSVDLQAYGAPAKPNTVQVLNFKPLL